MTLHRDVGDTCIEKLAPPFLEPVPQVERDRLRLGVEAHGPQPLVTCSHQQPHEHGGAHPATPPGNQHRHSTDVPVREQPRGANHAPRGVFGKGVQGSRVEIVPFQVRRHALFADENRLAYWRDQRLRRTPGDESDRVRGVHNVWQSDGRSGSIIWGVAARR